ncbi:hypothetical protein DIPPA_09938 [Diplonema papillatum]|nr:hypothetical protein DIPPA_09938 [Diplonema papillatum]
MGAQWANTIRSVITNQWYSLTLEPGFTTPMRMTRGVTQGSVLSVALYLFYTRKPPETRADYTRAIVDDITTLTTAENAANDLRAIEGWAEERHFTLAEKKTKLVSKTPWTLTTTTRAIKTIQTTRLLGACLHATATKTCSRNERVIEAYCRTTDLISQAKYKPTIRKAAEHRTYAVARLSLHCLSVCFDPTAQKVQAAGWKLEPKHYGGRGIKGFGTCKSGYGITNIADYTTIQRTRAHLASGSDRPIPTRGITRRKPNPTNAPAFLNALRELLANAPTQTSDCEVATDGGWYANESVGTIGIAIGGRRLGAVIVGRVSSSTQAELAAMLCLATALKMTQIPRERVHWWTDSQTALARQRHEDKEDLYSRALHDEAIPQIQWTKGHADCVTLNQADKATREAYTAGEYHMEMEYCFHYWNEAYIYLHPEGLQCEAPADFVKRILREQREAHVIRAIEALVPRSLAEPKRMRRLGRIPGAADLLQAIIRRTILQQQTRQMCNVRHCTAYATAQHVLLTDDPAHNEGGRTPTDDWKTLHGLLEAYAKKQLAAIAFVCNRLSRQCTEDRAVQRWIAACRLSINQLRS